MSLFRVSLSLVGTVLKRDSESIRKWLKMKFLKWPKMRIQRMKIKIRPLPQVKFETDLFKHLKVPKINVKKILP